MSEFANLGTGGIPRRYLFLALGTLFAAGSAGLALSPVLLAEAPLLLVALNPLPRHVLMVAPLTDFLPLMAVVVIRRELSCIVTYFTGQAYGERAIGYTEQRKPRIGRILRRLSALFERVGVPMLMLAPNLGAVLAGSSRMRLSIFLPATLLGQVWVAAFTYYLGDRFKDYILPVVDLVREHAVALTLASVTLVLARQLWRRRKGKGLVLPLPDDPAP